MLGSSKCVWNTYYSYIVRRPDVGNNIFPILYICTQVFLVQVSEIEFRLFPNPVFDYVCRDNPLTRIRIKIRGNEFFMAPHVLRYILYYGHITYRNIKEVIWPVSVCIHIIYLSVNHNVSVGVRCYTSCTQLEFISSA